jgi:hypothetical protein
VGKDSGPTARRRPGKSDLVGRYIDVRTGELATITYRLREPKQVASTGRYPRE